MATWRRRDLERRGRGRSGGLGRILRAEMILALIALALSAAALWQALAIQSRTELMAHDLSAATARLRSLDLPGPALTPAGPAGAGSLPSPP